MLPLFKLCSLCSNLVDKNGGIDYPVEVLRFWKLAAEKSAREQLVRSATAVKDNCVSTLIYINVPRLIHYASLTGWSGSFPDDFREGVPREGWIVRELLELERAIVGLEFPALSWQETTATIEDPIGMLVSFEGRFRTKNGPKSREQPKQLDMTNLKTAPHIYASQRGVKFVLPYDPRFLTTNTAVVEFSSGQVQVGGFAIIKKVTEKEVWATPLFVGLQSSPEGRALMNALASHR
ncbi:MAG: hypothetical protein WD823_02830 [Sulfuricaulis sp.]|uniref:hypothetical protein n=1 Tax=Sulfuricaulis sp. TaxID=2003553 RepID=UPI0034A3583B